MVYLFKNKKKYHLIISDKSFLSFRDIVLLEELENSTKYVPSYVLEKRIKKEASEIAEQKKAFEIAKQLKRKKIADDVIASATGLTLEEVQRLRVRT